MPKKSLQDHAFYRNIKKLKKCIDRGDDLDGPNEEGNSALHWAIEKGHVKAVEALLAAGADIEIENTLDANNTALMLASQYGIDGHAGTRCRAGSSVRMQKGERRSPLH